jgi:TonB-dependent receptor
VRTNIARTTLSRALALALLGLVAAPVLAQEQAQEPGQQEAQPVATELDRVQVTGYRQSLQYSTEAKREAVGFIDSIFSEDIGKFPDTNIAESLTRVPGIQLNRDVNGEGLNIGIRGLPQSFTKTLINGGEVATASVGLNQGNQNRETDLNLFPTEFFNQLTVYKTPQASLPEGGVSGVVDMRTARPFDRPGQHLTYNLQGEYNSLVKNFNPRGSAIWSWTNDAGTFGALVGASVSRSEIGVYGFETIGWMSPALNRVQCGQVAAGDAVDADYSTRPGECNVFGATSLQMPNFVPDDPSTIGAGLTPGDVIDAELLMALNPGLSIHQISSALFPRLGRPVDMTGDRNRDAVMSSLEWRPSDNAHFHLDSIFTHAKFENDRIDMNLVGRTFGPVGFIPIGMQLDENNVVTSATLTNAQFFLEARPYRDEVKYWNVAPGGSFWFRDGEIRWDVSGLWSRSWFFRESPTILVTSPHTTLQYRNDGNLPTWDTGGLDLNDPNAGWSFAGGRVNLNNEKRVTEAGRLRTDLQFGADDRRNIKVGASYDTYYRTIVAFDNSAEWQAHVLSVLTDADLPRFLRPGPGFITADFRAFFDATDYRRFFDEAPEANTSQSVGAASGGIDERNIAAYVELNGETEVLGRNLRFNAGMRWVETKQEVSAPVTFGDDRFWLTLGSDYQEWLPSFNAAWDVADRWVVRLAGSRTMTRPNPRSMLPITTFSDPSAEQAVQGNPELSPYLSTNVDLGVEWYTGGEGLVSVGVFNKNIDGYTYEDVNVRPFRDLGIPIDTLGENQRAALDANGGLDAPIRVRQQINASASVDIRGFEFIWVQPLDFVFDGLGFMGNFSKINLGTSGRDAERLGGNLLGIAPKMWNATVYWENERAAARLSYNWRDGFPVSTVGGAFGGGPNFAQTRVLERGQLDLSASYNLPGLWSSPQLTFNVINITNKEQRMVTEFDNMVYEAYIPGRTFMIGIRGSF